VVATQVTMSNSDYTDDGVDNKEVRYVTTTKAFYFTTGAAAGTVPRIVSTSPTTNATVTSRSGEISFTFDQNIEREPYSVVLATPINGSESTTTASSLDLSASVSLKVRDGNTLYLDYGEDGLKYDLYYEVVVPANTVTGVGGRPNESFTLKFKVGKNSKATEVDQDTFYPHTWDFNKFGDEMIEGTTAYKIKNYYGDPGNTDYRINSLYQETEDQCITYKTKAQTGYGFDQGADVYFNYWQNRPTEPKVAGTEVMDEFKGIRISLADSRSTRFEIRNLTSNDGIKNSDGTEKWIFRLNGNTHYMTLSNVPVGKLYMVVNSPYIGINSPNATFTNVAGTTIENKGTLMNTNGTKKVVINVSAAGDVSFCVKNFNCEKIGVAEDEKTFNANYAESGKTYATDRLTYDVRYDLLNAFTDHNVKAYYVSSIANNPSDNTGIITATEVPLTVAKGNQGVMVLYQSALGSNTTVPIFKTDVNSAAESATNKLKVISSGSTSLPSIDDDYYMYVLSNRGAKTSGISFYRYTGSTFSDRAAYLEVPKTWVEPASGGASRIIRLVFEDEDGSETTMIRTIEADGVSENIEQNGDYYDLRGQRIAKPSKPGLYIKNGKKLYVK
jgi:hypothetical protein